MLLYNKKIMNLRTWIFEGFDILWVLVQTFFARDDRKFCNDKEELAEWLLSFLCSEQKLYECNLGR